MTGAKAVPFDAVNISLEGKNLVAASAGTGKTYAITTLFVRLLLEKELDPSAILVVTFTDAATAELRDRVRSRLGEAEAAFRRALRGEPIEDDALRGIAEKRKQKGELEGDLARLRRAVENIDDAPISTIHGFCQRVLHDNAFGTRVPFGAQLVPDLSELCDDVLYDFWQKRVAGASEGLARQAQALGVDIARARRLFEEARRNPRVKVVPAATEPTSVEDIEKALDEVRALRQTFDGLAFVADKALKGEFGGGPALTELLDGARAALEVTDPAELCFPSKVERLFSPYVEANLQKKFLGDPDARHPFFTAFEKLVRMSWAGVLALEIDLLKAAPQDLLNRKLALGVLGFEDLLLRVADAVAGEGAEELKTALRNRFQAVLIDEFQDTDPVQFEIFHGVFGDGKHPLFLIGDPKQAIYAFRGADVFAYLDAAQNARGSTMGTSYRSDPGLIRAVNALFRPKGTFLIDGIGYADVTARKDAKNAFCAPHLKGPSSTASLDLMFLERMNDEAPVNKPVARHAAARAVAADIAELLNGKATLERKGKTEAVSAADIAVLTRTNAQCFLVQETLRERGIHSVVITDKSVFEADEAADVQMVLGAVLDPMSRFDLRRAVATSLLGVTGDTIAEKEQDAQWWQEWTLRFRSWHALWVERGFIRMFRALLDESGVAEQLLKIAGGERRLTNVLHLGELLHRASTEQHLGPGALLAWLADQRAGRSATMERAEIRLESDEAAVKILTVHKAKGLEFPIVYCPFLWDGGGGKPGGPCRFHDGAGHATLDIDVDAEARKPNLAREAWEGFAEEIRVAYVALTRAQHRTVILWGGFNKMGSTAAAFLLHPPGSLGSMEVPGADRLRELTDEQLCAALSSVVARSEGDFALRRVPWSYDAKLTRDVAADVAAFEPRKLGSRIFSWQRTSSFSNLVKRELGWHLDEDEGRDHEEEPLGAGGSVVELAAAPPQIAAPVERARITLDGFPRGRRTGDLIHDVFEELDFATATDERILEVVQAKLEGFGFTASFDATELELRQTQLVQALRETLQTPLLAGGPRLVDIDAAHKFAELEFRMPVGSGSEGLTRQRLARVFRDHPSTEPAGAVSAEYAERVEQLGFRTLRGFLKGYIDLVFEHDGRWYVVDYKTNHLGDHRDEYSVAAMTEALGEAHYYLQYHLYALALDRYLRSFQQGYDYATHFGGVLYLFIKGMHPGSLPSHGIFFERPPLARMRALSAALGDVGRAELGGAP